MLVLLDGVWIWAGIVLQARRIGDLKALCVQPSGQDA